MFKNLMVVLMLSVFAIGCAGSNKYTWKNYDGVLYSYYKNPKNNELLLRRFNKIIVAGERNNTVPPGLYAECGYLLFELKRYSEAKIYFEKEILAWPESEVFMIKMINKMEDLEV
jgi:hypothetical protein